MCLSTTTGCTSAVGAQKNSSNTVSATHSDDIETSRDGHRVYVTDSLFAAWDEVCYPGGVGASMAELDADVSVAVLSLTSDSSPWLGFPRPAGAPSPAARRRRAPDARRFWGECLMCSHGCPADDFRIDIFDAAREAAPTIQRTLGQGAN